eukprot:gene7743-7804_t
MRNVALQGQFSDGRRQPYERTLLDIRRAFEDAGVEFIERGTALAPGGEGVRLKQLNPLE